MISVPGMAVLLTFSCCVLGGVLTAYAVRYQASAAIRFCFALMFAGNGIVLLNLAGVADVFQAIGVAAILLYGPALWWLVVSQITGERRLFHWRHLLPAVASLGLALWQPDQRVHLMAFNASVFLAYLAVAATQLYAQRHALSEQKALLWLAGYLFLGTWYSFWTLFSYGQYIIGASLLSGETIRLLQAIVTQVTALALTWWAITRPDLYLDGPRPTAAPVEATSFDRDVFARAQTLFATERIFTRDDLALETVADRLAVTPRELSHAINRCSGAGFRTFLRKHRIAYATALLTDPAYARNSIFDLALKAGYSNKSTFNIAFKAEMNETPSEYRAGAKTMIRGGQ